jgi:hypothetical protein
VDGDRFLSGQIGHVQQGDQPFDLSAVVQIDGVVPALHYLALLLDSVVEFAV